MLTKRYSVKYNSWMQKRLNDKFTQRAKTEGLRSRSWFKLDEIQNRDYVLHLGSNVIDLGSSPGGWSKYASKQIGQAGHVIACDILPMRPIHGVKFFQQDCSIPEITQILLNHVGKLKIDVILSDMSPNISGISAIDIPKFMHLAKLSLNICQSILTLHGNFIIKIFQGENFSKYLQEIKRIFSEVKIRKPIASNIHSKEIYIVAKGNKINN